MAGTRTHEDPAYEAVDLRTERLLLRAFTFADVDEVLAYEREPVMTRYHVPGPPFSRANAETMVRRRIAQRPSWAIVRPSAERPRGPVVGHVRCSVWANTGTAEFGYSIAPDLWGQGLATEAVGAVTDYAFETFGLQKLFGELVEPNIGSARVLERIGMQLEGRTREQVPIRDGTRVDVLHYGILREEWEQRR